MGRTFLSIVGAELAASLLVPTVASLGPYEAAGALGFVNWLARPPGLPTLAVTLFHGNRPALRRQPRTPSMKVPPRLPAMVRGLVQLVDSALVSDAPTARAIQLAAHRVGYGVGEICPVAPPAPGVEALASAVYLSRVRPEATWRGAADAGHARDAAKGVGGDAGVGVVSS